MVLQLNQLHEWLIRTSEMMLYLAIEIPYFNTDVGILKPFQLSMDNYLQIRRIMNITLVNKKHKCY